MRSSITRWFVVVVALVGIVAGVASYGESSTTAGGRNGILNVYAGANTGFTRNFNPFSQAAQPGAVSMIYEALFYFNQARNGDVQPQRATAYEFADDGRTINFTVRDGVKCSGVRAARIRTCCSGGSNRWPGPGVGSRDDIACRAPDQAVRGT